LGRRRTPVQLPVSLRHSTEGQIRSSPRARRSRPIPWEFFRGKNRCQGRGCGGKTTPLAAREPMWRDSASRKFGHGDVNHCAYSSRENTGITALAYAAWPEMFQVLDGPGRKKMARLTFNRTVRGRQGQTARLHRDVWPAIKRSKGYLRGICALVQKLYVPPRQRQPLRPVWPLRLVNRRGFTRSHYVNAAARRKACHRLFHSCFRPFPRASFRGLGTWALELVRSWRTNAHLDLLGRDGPGPAFGFFQRPFVVPRDHFKEHLSSAQIGWSCRAWSFN